LSRSKAGLANAAHDGQGCAPWLTPEGIPVTPVYGAADVTTLDFLDT